MSEATIQTSIQTALQALDEFADDDVFIDDWERLDGPTVNAPYAQILTAADYDQRQDSREVVVTWGIPVVLYVRWLDWQESLQELCALREVVMGAFRNDGGALDSASSDLIVTRVQSGGDIDEYFAPYGLRTSDEQLPTFLLQRQLITVVETVC